MIVMGRSYPDLESEVRRRARKFLYWVSPVPKSVDWLSGQVHTKGKLAGATCARGHRAAIAAYLGRQNEPDYAALLEAEERGALEVARGL
jgi:hypothetical protein